PARTAGPQRWIGSAGRRPTPADRSGPAPPDAVRANRGGLRPGARRRAVRRSPGARPAQLSLTGRRAPALTRTDRHRAVWSSTPALSATSEAAQRNRADLGAWPRL